MKPWVPLAALLLLPAPLEGQTGPAIERRTCVSADGVTLVYSAAGRGDVTLLFIHGGMADRTFFIGQLEAFADRYRVMALDLAGHGESGANRKTWSMRQFGSDVAAVLDAEQVRRAILFGNSLGGPVAIEAALMLPGRVLGVVGIDTFQDLGAPRTAEYTREVEEAMRKRAESLRADFRGAMKTMVKMLFHTDADPGLVADTERRMLRTSPAVVHAMLAGIADYDSRLTAAKLTVPLRAINGDLFPTDILAIRTIKPDFDAVVMPHVGHYPMLERPEAFNGHVEAVAKALSAR